MIVRRIDDVETIDVGKPFGLPDNTIVIQWIFSNEVGDEKYHHKHAVRKYTYQPGLPWRLCLFTTINTCKPRLS